MSIGDRDDHWTTWVGPPLAKLRKGQLVEIYNHMRHRGYGESVETATIETLTRAIEAGRKDYWALKRTAQASGASHSNRAAGTLPNSRDHKQRSTIPAAGGRISAREVNEMLRGFPNHNFNNPED